MIEITGYVTEKYEDGSFTLKITNDNVEDEKGNHPEVSKEIRIIIAAALYPSDYGERFEITQKSHHISTINQCLSISRALKRGDRVKCSVFIVTTTGNEYDNNKTYIINKDINDRETYTKYSPLWLDPNLRSFGRFEADTPETLKFRKENYYTNINLGKCAKITGNTSNDYANKWWINKHPKITFSMRCGIRFRTTVSNLWKRFTEQKTLTIFLTIVTIISVIFNIIQAFLLLTKNP